MRKTLLRPSSIHLDYDDSTFALLQDHICRDTRHTGAFARQSCSIGVQASHCSSFAVQPVPVDLTQYAM